MTTKATTTYSDTVQQAFRDWNEHRAYVDNGGNYRVRPEAATPTHRPAGKVAPWNKEVKRLFPSCAEFHGAAQESVRQETQQAVRDAQAVGRSESSGKLRAEAAKVKLSTRCEYGQHDRCANAGECECDCHQTATGAAQESLEPGLLTEEEAQLVIGAIPLQALPAADTGAEWHVVPEPIAPVVAAIKANGLIIASCMSTETANQIVSDHSAVRKLAAALRSRVSPTRCYCNVMAGNTCADCEHRALLATLATVSDAAKEQTNQ